MRRATARFFRATAVDKSNGLTVNGTELLTEQYARHRPVMNLFDKVRWVGPSSLSVMCDTVPTTRRCGLCVWWCTLCSFFAVTSVRIDPLSRFLAHSRSDL